MDKHDTKKTECQNGKEKVALSSLNDCFQRNVQCRNKKKWKTQKKSGEWVERGHNKDDLFETN